MDSARSRHFFGNAWQSLASTRNLFGKLCLLALIQFIPILGQIVSLGYMLGWAREAAWKMETPLPPHVFGRDDDSFWARGALGFVVCILYGIIQWLALGLLAAVYALCAAGLNLDGGVLLASGIIFCILEILLALWLGAIQVIGMVRMAIYNSFGAAFQWGVICKMIGREFGGLFKLFWTAVLACVILGLLSSFVALFLGPALVGVGIGVPLASTVVSYGEITQDTTVLLGSVLAASVLVSVAGLAVTFFFTVPALMVEALLWRALGSWVALFDVPSWGGRHEPLPCELPPASTADIEPSDVVAPIEAVQPSRRSHPLLVGLGCMGIILLIGLACSGCVAAMAASLYNSGTVQIDIHEAAQALREAADEALQEWNSLWY